MLWIFLEKDKKNPKFLSRNRDVFSPNEPIEFVKMKQYTFRGTYVTGTKFVETVDPNIIKLNYKILDDKPPDEQI